MPRPVKAPWESEFGLSDSEKEELMKTLDPVTKQLQKYSDEIENKHSTKITES